MRSFPIGRLLLIIIGAFTAVSPWVFDFGETHMFNDRWPPHAKFHNAQTLLMGTFLGLLTIHYAWKRSGEDLDGVRAACLIGALYWMTQAGAGLLPNTAPVDPEFASEVPHPFGLAGPQPVLDVLMLVAIAVAYVLERRRILRDPSTTGQPTAPATTRTFFTTGDQ